MPAVLQALLAAALFGACLPVAKLLALDAHPLFGSALLYGGAGLAAAALPRGPDAPLRRSDLPIVVGMILAGGLAAPVLLLLGLRGTGGGSASLLLNLETPFTALIAVALFHEHLGRKSLLGGAVILSAAVLLSWNGGAGSLSGALLVGGACAGWALDNNLSGKLSLRDPRRVVAWKGLGAAACATLLGALLGAPLPSPATAAGGLALGGLGYGASMLLYLRAQRGLGAARTAVLFATGPFLGALFSWPLLDEPAGPLHLAAGVLMALGVALFLRERHEHQHVHAALEHEHLHTHDEHHQHSHRGDEGPEPHSHAHLHVSLVHRHPHVSDLHHRHSH